MATGALPTCRLCTSFWMKKEIKKTVAEYVKAAPIFLGREEPIKSSKFIHGKPSNAMAAVQGFARKRSRLYQILDALLTVKTKTSKREIASGGNSDRLSDS